MTKESLAAQLNNREIGNEITPEEEAATKAAGLVVIFGASDDLCELRGAIHDELGAYREATILIDRSGKLLPEIEDGDVETLQKYGVLGAVQALHRAATTVHAFWRADPDYSWTYETKAPHATFDLLDYDEKYCRGIVLDLKEICDGR